MPIKPSGYPLWASNATNITEPLDSKKVVGWSVSEKPSSAYMNWLQQKQSDWIRYLSYDWLISDDFVVGDQYLTGSIPASGGTATGLFPWTVDDKEYVRLESTGEQANGVMRLQMVASGSGSLYRSMRGWTTDAIFEGVAAYKTRGGTGTIVRMGVVGGGQSGGIWFSVTGPSSPWLINWFPPSGGAATAYNLNSDPHNATAYTVLSWEKRGATCVVDVNGSSAYAMAVAPITSQVIGVEAYGTTGLIFDVDRIRFGTRRP